MRSVHFDGSRLHIITAFVLFLEDNSRFQFLACSMLLYCFLTFPILSSPSCGSPRKTNQSLSPFFPTIGLLPCLLFIYPLFLPFQSLFVFTIRPASCTSFHWELHCWIHALLQRFSKTYYILYFIREKNTVCAHVRHYYGWVKFVLIFMKFWQRLIFWTGQQHFAGWRADTTPASSFSHRKEVLPLSPSFQHEC